MRTEVGVAFVGTGKAFKRRVDNLPVTNYEEIIVHALYNRSPDKLHAAKEWLKQKGAHLDVNVTKLFSGEGGYDEVLNYLSDKDVFVSIHTQTVNYDIDGKSFDTHGEYVRRALDIGKPCFVENPLAASSENAQKIFDISRRKNLPVYVGNNLNWHSFAGIVGEYIRDTKARVRSVENIWLNYNTELFDPRKYGNIYLDLQNHPITLIYNWLKPRGFDSVEINRRGDTFHSKFILKAEESIPVTTILSYRQPQDKIRRQIKIETDGNSPIMVDFVNGRLTIGERVWSESVQDRNTMGPETNYAFKYLTGDISFDPKLLEANVFSVCLANEQIRQLKELEKKYDIEMPHPYG